MQASVLDLRRRMSKVLQALNRNESVTLLYRGKPKGVIHPTPVTLKNKALSILHHPAFGMWEKHKDLRDVEKTVDEIRKGRTHVV